MKYLNIIYTSLPHKLLPVLLAFLFILVAGGSIAQEKEKPTKKKKEKRFDVEFGLASTYDDNILKYSEKYLERFMANQDFGRFHIETSDDIILKPSLKLAYTFKVFKKQKTKINFDYSYSAYVVNDVKNWTGYSIGLLQNFAKRASFKISYNYIPEFYVRHFRDQDMVDYYSDLTGFGYVPETFVPFSFSKDNYGFWIQKTMLKNTRVRLALDYAKYFHNQHYTEYDCDNLVYGIQITQPLNKVLKVEAGFEFETSDAKGYDNTDKDGFYAPDETMETSDDADATNQGETYFLGCSWQIPELAKHKHSFDAKIGYERRKYTTEDGPLEDPEHAGRLDQNLNLAFTYDFTINKYFSATAFYKFFGRDSSTSSELNSTYVSNEKDYKQNQIGLAVSYSLKF